MADVEHSRKTPCPHCGKTFLRMGNLMNHVDRQTCLKGSALPAIEKPLEVVMEEMVMEEIVMEEIVMEDSYCQRGSALALTRPELPMMKRAEEGLHCFWEEDTGLEVLLVQVGRLPALFDCLLLLGGVWWKAVLGRAAEGG